VPTLHQTLTPRRSRRRAVVAALGALAVLAALGVLAVVGLDPDGSGGQSVGTVVSVPGPGVCRPATGGCPYTSVRQVGRRGAGVLRVPEAIAIAPGGDVYEGDQFGYVVQRFSRTGQFKRQFGSHGSGPGQFGSVGALAVAADGDVYVLDSTNDRIEVFTADGRFLRQWGGPGTGLGQFSFGKGGRAEIPPGGGLALSGAHVYVSDSGGDRIERFTREGTHPKVIGGPGSGPGRFSDPRGLTIKGQHLYVADDHNHRVQVLTLSGHYLAQTPPAKAGPGFLADPYDAAVDRQGDLFVADDNNNRIVRYTPGLRYATAWRHLDHHGATIGYIRALAVDGRGALYVADSARDRIVVFDRNGLPLRRWGTSGQSSGQFNAPLDVSSDGNGGYLVIEGYGSRARVQRLNGDFAVTHSWAGGGNTILGRYFFSPIAVAAQSDGSFWTTDQENGLVRHFSAAGRFLGAIGRATARPPHFDFPSGIASGPDGRLYVADTAHGRVVVLSRHGRLEGALTLRGALLGAPRAVAVDARGDVYVADAGRNRVYVCSTRPAGWCARYTARCAAPTAWGWMPAATCTSRTRGTIASSCSPPTGGWSSASGGPGRPSVSWRSRAG
jgi:DNA-binding beta-propeller fold protein YncE